MNHPSIFNDVIGPIMRGPSSSHCAGALRIGLLARELMHKSKFNEVLVEFDKDGSLATTHITQGSDMGLAGGLLGMNTTDPRLADAEKILSNKGINITYKIGHYEMDHPNTYQITLIGSREKHLLRAISSGGGMVEIISIDGVDILIKGDFFETLVFASSSDVIPYLSS
ncbi:MAG: serine dehydratase, partial [Deltaproteobacteria bacterium]|nr:serine dehydratase [Deltaproteobacteria bacterium]